MRRLLICSATLGVVLSSCAPIRTTIENDTGTAINVSVQSIKGKIVAYGEIPAHSGLNLENNIQDIGNVSYKFDRKTCSMTRQEFLSSAKKEHGAYAIHLSGC